jgi:hypothetical protein
MIKKIICCFDDVEIETEYERCEHQAEQPNNVAWPTCTSSVQQQSQQKKKALLNGLANSMMFTVVQVVVS